MISYHGNHMPDFKFFSSYLSTLEFLSRKASTPVPSSVSVWFDLSWFHQTKSASWFRYILRIDQRLQAVKIQLPWTEIWIMGIVCDGNFLCQVIINIRCCLKECLKTHSSKRRLDHRWKANIYRVSQKKRKFELKHIRISLIECPELIKGCFEICWKRSL